MRFAWVAGTWDVLVVGAGPAGAMAACLLAQQGRRVLLVDRAVFPRAKACGGCVTARGLALCRKLGLERALSCAAALKSVQLRAPGHAARFGIPPGLAVARDRFDTALAAQACAAGARFADGCSAALAEIDGRYRQVQLTLAGQTHVAYASLVLACDGVGGRLLDGEPACRWAVAPDAWMGAAFTLEDGPELSPRGAITMHLGGAGYVGAVQLADGRQHVAAALDARRCQEAGGPARLMGQIVEAASGIKIPAQSMARVLGTPLLTRSRAMWGARRVLALGDACQYVEPFTGEGMTWAIDSAMRLAEFLPRSLDQWPDSLAEDWTAQCRPRLKHQQTLCRCLRRLNRWPVVQDRAVGLVKRFPAVGTALAGWLGPIG